MPHFTQRCLGNILAALALGAAVGMPGVCSAGQPLAYERDVLPILTQHCLGCHGGFKGQRELDFRTYAGAMRGSENGPVIAAGKPAAILLWQKVAADEMPKGINKLSADEKKILEQWIAEGAVGVDVAAAEKVELPTKPRAAGEVAAAIDADVEARLKLEGLSPAPLADDATFLRRVSLDLTGTPPTLAATRAFLADESPERREKLINQLLASPACDKHFATMWHNLLVPFIDGKRVYDEPFRQWLAARFQTGQGWNQTAAEILAASGDVKTSPQIAFLARLPEPNEATDAVGRIFLGVQLECAECHDSPTTVWRQKDDFWGTAAMFGRLKVSEKGGKIASVSDDGGHELVKDLTEPGIRIHDLAAEHNLEVVPPRVPGVPHQATPPAIRNRQEFAAWVAERENPFFARAIANRWWAQFFGRGLVNPVDDLREGNLASHPRVLKILSHELAISDFNMKHLAACICRTRAYQRSSDFPEGTDDRERQLFARATLRMLTPEMLHAALAQVLGSRGQMQGFLPPPPGKSKSAGGEADFVNFFAAREGPFNTADYANGVVQVLQLMNAGAINQLPSSSDLGRVVAGKTGVPPEQIVENVYLAVLCRLPNEQKRKIAAAYLQQHADLKQATGDLVWALLNGGEFTFNH